MNLSLCHRRFPPRSACAFTMVEIALALAVIGFALVAIIGVLPQGMSVQKDNHEETVINQDATYWMDVIRNGTHGYWFALNNSNMVERIETLGSGVLGLNDLTNYVYAITNVVTPYEYQPLGPFGRPVQIGPSNVLSYTYTNCTLNGVAVPPVDVITNGYRIVGLLSTPRYLPQANAPGQPGRFLSNYITAYARAMSGVVTDKPPQTNQDIQALAFSYRLTPEIIPYSNSNTNWTNYFAMPVGTPEWHSRSNYWRLARTLNYNLYELRLTFHWPLLPNGLTGGGRQSFRTTISGHQISQTNETLGWHFFESRGYVRAP